MPEGDDRIPSLIAGHERELLDDWVREQLADLSRTRALRGFSPSETATFVLSLKPPLFRLLRRDGGDPEALLDGIARVTRLLDELGLFTTGSGEEVIRRQRQELLELSRPVVKLWDGVVVVPLIGPLDSARTQVVMESLLERIVETAARLMGADCVISGIRPQIAQTIVQLGIALQDVASVAEPGRE